MALKKRQIEKNKKAQNTGKLHIFRFKKVRCIEKLDSYNIYFITKKISFIKKNLFILIKFDI